MTANKCQNYANNISEEVNLTLFCKLDPFCALLSCVKWSSFLSYIFRGRIFSCVQPFYERAVSDLDRSVHRSYWVQVAHRSFIEGSHMTKNMASVFIDNASKKVLQFLMPVEPIYSKNFCFNEQKCLL